MSPLLANIYLYHAFDSWMEENHSTKSFERYADDIVMHCTSKLEAEQLLVELTERMQTFELTLHPDKTKIVYCKNYQRTETHDKESFTFLSYSFQPRTIKSKFSKTKRLLVFRGAICTNAKNSNRSGIRSILRTQWSMQTLEWIAEKLNPKLRGWINYYSKLTREECYSVFYYLNERIRRWISKTYKLTIKGVVFKKYQLIQKETPYLFYHWKLGIK